MERLNEYVEAQKFLETLDWDDIPNSDEPLATICDALQEIQKYKYLEEQGLLLRLPCEVGDTVYVIAPNYEKCKHKTECEDYDSEEFLVSWCKVYCRNGYKGMGVIPTIVERVEVRETGIYIFTEYGYRNVENFFLTKAEAEQKLKEME